MRYRVKPWVLNGFLSRLVISSNSQDDYNLISRKPWIKDRSIKQDNKTVPPLPKDTPQIIQDAVSRFSANYYCRPQVLSHLENYLRRVSTDVTGKWNLKHANDLCVFHVVDHNTEDKEGEICSYTPEYTLQRTGRIDTAMQSCSKQMKVAAYGEINNLYNYDLTSSQAYIALYEMRRYGIECSWLEDYIADSKKKAEYAKDVGITVAAWKQCLYTLLMGGPLPTNAISAFVSKVSILDYLGRGKVPIEVVSERLSKLWVVLKPFLKPLKLWHEAVLTEAKDNDGVITNSLGLVRQLKGSELERAAPIIAHKLQGAEAQYIHTVTVIAEDFGFVPLGNEHDGLITMGEIPTEAIRYAGELTGMHYLDLRQKPFL